MYIFNYLEQNIGLEIILSKSVYKGVAVNKI